MSVNRIALSFEDRIFKTTLYIGIVINLLLIPYDIFFTADYHSVVLEMVSISYFVTNLLLINRFYSKIKYRYIFSMILMTLVNIAWLSGGGVNLLNTSLYFLCLAVILIINDSKIYWFILLAVTIDFLLLFYAQYFTELLTQNRFSVDYANIINDYITSAIFIGFGGYLIAFLKSNFDKERTRLKNANDMISKNAYRISLQNEELIKSKSVLDKTINTLEEQAKELQGMKYSLEEKVQSRTDDLIRLNERLISQNQQLEQYTYITSHNLRSPIAQIKGLIHLLPEAKFDDLTNETISRLTQSAENLENVFSDLSTILKVEKGLQEPWQEIDLNLELDGVVKSLKPAIDRKKIEIRGLSKRKVNVKALRPYVYSIFHNLIENAVKYSDMDKKQSFISLKISDSKKYTIVIITDNGIGIDMDAASNKVFKMYQRFNNTHPGQGFGLFLVKSQMEAMNGLVEVESILGQGTTFKLYFTKR